MLVYPALKEKNMLKGIAIILVIAAVGSMGFSDEVDAHSAYCEMVTVGAWPDYRGVGCDEERSGES